MRIVNMQDAEMKFSRLVDAAAAGEQITITKADTPIVRLVKVGAEEAPQRIGFLAGDGRVPDDFNTLYSQEIADLFGIKRKHQ